MNKNFIRQEKRVIITMNKMILKAKRRAKEEILKCEKRIKEAQKNIINAKN